MSKKKKLSDILHERFDLFCGLCNLHGLSYLRSDMKLPICDRVFWISIFVSSFVLSCFLIYNVWHAWRNNPVMIAYDSAVRPVWDIPFPSVTICNFVQVKRSVLDLANTTDTKALFFSSLICLSKEFFENKNLSVTEEEMNEFYDFVQEVSPRCEEVLRSCYWHGEEVPCCKTFFPVLTNIGLCFITNSLPSHMLYPPDTASQFMFNDSYPNNSRFWNPDTGYPQPDRRGDEGDKTFPLWGKPLGFERGLNLKVEQDLDEWQERCSGGFSGFKMSKEKKLSDILHERFDLFCGLCNLHGLSYLRSDMKLPICDRVFWISIFVSSFVLSCFLIYNVWHAWRNNPVMIAYDSAVRPVWDIPFPSVTICNFVQVKRSVLDLANTTDTKALFFSSLICLSKEFFENKNLSVTEEEMNEFYDFVQEVSPRCEEVLRSCYWHGEEVPCCKTFFPVLTNIGLCFITNSLPSHMLYPPDTASQFMFNDSYPNNSRFWNPDTGYPHPDRRGDEGDKTFPLWGKPLGFERGLNLKVEQDLDEWQERCSGGFSGFKIFVSSPEESPITSQAALRVPMRRDFHISLTPNTIVTSTDLMSTAFSRRGCLFQSEKNLQFFKIHTQNNCILDCLLKAALRNCRCVPFYMPRNASVPACRKDTDQVCLHQVENDMVANSMVEDSNSLEPVVPWCGCYPSCNDLTYSHVTSHGFYFNDANIYEDFPHGDAYTQIVISYADRQFLGVHRRTVTSFNDFLGTCGGLLGLFMGFSCLSAAEVVYHLTLRPLFQLISDRRRRNISPNVAIKARPPLRGQQILVKSYY